MHNNNFNNLLSESLSYKDMEGLLKPTVHVDEFSSKMGDDDDIVVLSFFVRNDQAAKDLMSWFEKGYDFVLDADRSPGEIKPGRYLVYVEIRRRSTAGANVEQLLNDLNTLTEFENSSDWTMHYKGKSTPFSRDAFDGHAKSSLQNYKLVQRDLSVIPSASQSRLDMRLLLTLLARIFHGKKLTEFPFKVPGSDMRCNIDSGNLSSPMPRPPAARHLPLDPC
jgi:hypothetical protein